MNSKILAVIVAVLVTSGAGVGVYLGSQSNQSTPAVNDYAVSDPSSGPVTNSTIYAENSTIIAGQGTTIIGGDTGLNSGSSPNTSVISTAEPTSTPEPTITITYSEVNRTKVSGDFTIITISTTISGQLLSPLNTNSFTLSTVSYGAILSGHAQENGSVGVGSTTLTFNVLTALIDDSGVKLGYFNGPTDQPIDFVKV